MSEQYILLVGMPRSGTSWVAKIFDSRPDVAYFHEPDSSIKLDFLELIHDRDLDEPARALVRDTVASFWTMREERVIGSLPVFRKQYQSPLQHQLYRLTNSVSKYSARLLGSPLLLPARAIDNAGILVWKSIESLGRVAQLKQALGERLKIVQIVRHPAGQVHSTLSGEARKQFGSYRAAEDRDLFSKILNSASANRLGYSIADFESMSPARRLAAKWAIYNDHAYASGCCDALLNYDELCRSPLPVIERICACIGLSVSPEVERFIEESTSRERSRYYSVYKSPLASSNKWKAELDATQKREIAETLAPSEVYRLFDGLD